MSTSIKTGIKRLSKKNIGFVIIQSDMPFIKTKHINKIYRSILSKNYKFQEIKKKALVNYIDPTYIGNKTLKRTWVKALTKTYNWGFNTFVVGVKGNRKHPLCGQIDVLLMIQNFI